MSDQRDDDGDGGGGGGDGSEDDEPRSRPGLPDLPDDVDAAVAADDHALPPEELQYPEFEFDEGAVAPDGTFDLTRDLDREATQALLRDLAGGLASHDVGVAAPNRRVTLGVAPGDVEMSFDPDDDHTGTFEVTLSLRAKAMDVQDGDAETVGARGGQGFVPLAMLTEDGDPSEYRCYNWVEDPTADSEE